MVDSATGSAVNAVGVCKPHYELKYVMLWRPMVNSKDGGSKGVPLRVTLRKARANDQFWRCRWVLNCGSRFGTVNAS